MAGHGLNDLFYIPTMLMMALVLSPTIGYDYLFLLRFEVILRVRSGLITPDIIYQHYEDIILLRTMRLQMWMMSLSLQPISERIVKRFGCHREGERHNETISWYRGKLTSDNRRVLDMAIPLLLLCRPRNTLVYACVLWHGRGATGGRFPIFRYPDCGTACISRKPI
jgi:hypothetical protein